MAAPTKRVRIAFGVLPGAGEPDYLSWVDVTDKVRSITMRVGRQLDLARVEAGTAVIELDNSDGRFSPENTSGIYYPNVRPFAQVEIAYISDGDLTPFTLGVAALGAASATLYTTPPTTSVKFRGLAERWRPTWWNPRSGYVTLECVDLFRYLQFADLIGTTYPQQTVGARITAVLADIANPFPVSIDSTGMTLASSTPTGKALDYMRSIAELDGGLFYSRGDGKIVYTSRATMRAASTYRTVQAPMSDQVGGLNYLAPVQAMDEQQVINRVIGSTSGGTPITAQEDATSQSYYLKRTKDFGTSAAFILAELQERALIELVTKKAARLRWDGLEFEVLDPNLDATTLMGLDINHRVTVTRTPDQGSAISGPYLVEGWEDVIKPKTWRRTFKLSNAPSASFILGTSTLGDTAVL